MEAAMWTQEEEDRDWYERDTDWMTDEEDRPMEYGGYVGDEAEWARDYDRERL